ncbi:hypothetical protein Ping_2688 [Psychromonas ingrahamii 37]|uniref:Uncharacterized protein n=1 Tax=Psychromonas ingrahamii (strain DSM 17664 / CCUG 51855 / 37) TaxID=357804 RepID=A1SY34_PSYIN|nr:hypothetical protein [Psychromonas ingrahamii]ABM04399.1 hypothetical protein Ping_2688 [Psychromonas ingrahamii 37]
MNLTLLREKYSIDSEIDSLFAFRDAFKRTIVCKKQSLIDLSVVAANLSPQIFWNDDVIDPLVLKAINDTNPNFSPDLLSNYSDEQMMGILNSTKGKYFEYLVEDKLNAGATVGDVALPKGYSAEVASNITQPGWDLQILDQNGNVADYLQLKATNSISYIHDTLERYPDITILGTSEIANQTNGLILDSNINEQELTEQLSNVINDMDSSITDDFLEAFNPLLPLVFILSTEGYRVYVGKGSTENLYESAKYRVERALISSGVGAIVYSLGGGWLSLASTIIAGGVYDSFIENSLTNYNFDKTTYRLKCYRSYQQQLILNNR